MVNYSKLKTNLRLCVNRLKLLEKKKTELAFKSRKEIADYLANGKIDRAKIRVEHIIREDYLVEAMEIVEMYCDLLLARFGLIEQVKTLDDGIAEAVASLIWVAPRLHSDANELTIIADFLAHKYGKQYAQAARENSLKTVNPKLIMKMGIEAPPKILVEKYLIEIAKNQNIEYEPDPAIMNEAQAPDAGSMNEKPLIDLGNNSQVWPQMPPPLPSASPQGFLPQSPTATTIGFNIPGPQTPVASMPPMPNKQDTPVDSTFIPPKESPPHYDTLYNKPSISGPSAPSSNINKPTLNTSNKPSPAPRKNIGFDNLPDLPDVPDTSPGGDDQPNDSSDNIDFDDLTKRFNALKKKK